MEAHAKPLAIIVFLSVLALAGCTSTPTASLATLAATSPSPVESPGTGGSFATTPSTAESASTFECDDHTTGCAGNLSAGAHSSSNFSIPLRLTVPEGWVNVRDIARTYEVEPARTFGVRGHPEVQVLAMNAIPDPATCDAVPLAGAGTSVQDFIDHVSGQPGLEAATPAPATLDGYRGQSIDFRVRADWTANCPDLDPTNPVVLMLTSTNTDTSRRHLAYTRDVRVRWIVLDVAGETVIVEFVAPAGRFDAEIAQDQAIIDSLDFTPRT